jgi:hypothetical protein
VSAPRLNSLRELRGWCDEIADEVDSKQDADEATTRDFYSHCDSGSETDAPRGGSGGGSGDTETVTGAVNGVPATLVVVTEGTWVEI